MRLTPSFPYIGKLHGLGLILDTQQWDYFYSSDFHRVSSGFQVMVYDRNEVPLVSELGFAVGPGTENLVGLEITEVRKPVKFIFKMHSKPEEDGGGNRLVAQSSLKRVWLSLINNTTNIH